MKIIHESDIVDTYNVCPYCMYPKPLMYTSCCGEVHNGKAHELEDGSVYLDHEIVIHDSKIDL